jgi:hypothetical protein
MATLFGLYPFLLKLYADGGYQGPQFQGGLRRIMRQVDVEIVKRSQAFGCRKGLCGAPEALDCRTHHRVAEPLPSTG